MARQALEPGAVEAELAKLSGWALSDTGNAITKRFVFDNFRMAFGFMTQAALCAEKLDHHPEWTNVYSRVEVRLSTHDAGGLTKLDFELARFMDEAARLPVV